MTVFPISPTVIGPEGLILFTELRLIEPILRALSDEGYESPTPIQAQAIPPLLEGKDLVGIAQTGTGKTAAFAIPMIQALAESRNAHAPRTTRALVLTPTRELALQVDESVGNYGRHVGLKRACIFGGVSDLPQKKALSRGVDVLTATPGRLLDLLGQGSLTLSTLEFFVLDEADRMLDMGFIHDVRRIVALLPKDRQTLLFSATMPDDIAQLARTLLRNPVRVEVTPAATTVESIDQVLYRVEKNDKLPLLRQILAGESVSRALVFSRTKHGANKICERLIRQGISAAAIHGNKSQNRRQEALQGFKDGEIRVLVATDIAARGIDVDDVTHVINFDMPMEPETYVHRIGRTARAGASGHSISFCSRDEEQQLRQVERLIRRNIPLADVPDLSALRAESAGAGDDRPDRPRGRSPQQPRRSPHPAPGAPQQPRGQGSRSQGPRTQGNGSNPSRGQSQGGGAPRRQGGGQADPNRRPPNNPRPGDTTENLSEDAWKGSAFANRQGNAGRAQRPRGPRGPRNNGPRSASEPHSSPSPANSNGVQKAWSFVKSALRRK